MRLPGFIFLLLVPFFAISQSKADSLLKVIAETSDDSIRFDARLRYINEMRNNYAQVSGHVFEGMAKAKELHDFYFLGHFHAAAGVMYSQIGKNDSALVYFQNSLNYRIYTKDTGGIGASNLGLSNTYRNLGDYRNSIKYGLDAEKAFIAVADKSGLARTYNALGLVFKQQADYERALMYYEKGIAQTLAMQDEKMLSGLYSNVGGVYQEQRNFDSALVYIRKAYDIRRRGNDEMGLAISYGNFGLVFKEQGQLDSARIYTNRALEIFQKYNSGGGISMCYASLGRISADAGEYREALKAYKKSEEYALAGKFLSDLVDISYELAKTYEALGQYKESTLYLNKYLTYRDSLNVSEQTREIEKMQMEFEHQQEELADSLKRSEEARVRELEDLREKELNEQKMAELRLYIAVGIGGFVLVLVIAFILFRSNKRQKKFNEIIAQQKAVVEEKNREITDSITYAKRIQQAILPPRSLMEHYFPQSFVLYKPKDIVAGDFFWLGNAGDVRFIAAADCTGHGVPGAMVSVVCANALNRAVKEFNLADPGLILDKVRDLVIETFEKSERDVKDGMDIALVALRDGPGNTTEIRFSGANNPLWIIKKGERTIVQLKGDSQPIGQYIDKRPFSSHSATLQKGDSLYIFSDGYQDQFGGEKGKKFKASNLQQLIISIQHKPMTDQRTVLRDAFVAWRGQLEQLDDVCVIGIRL
jgi:serine phosphatase RsbU (regulator of sigma subunit)